MDLRYDIVCIGMAILDSIIKGFDPSPVNSTGYRAESGTLSTGGDAVNEAIAAAKLGMKTGILCALGNDPAGMIIEKDLEASGVDTRLIVKPEGHSTPITTIFVREDGDRRSITNGAHSYNFHPERYPAAYAEAGAVILGSLFRAPFNDPDVIREVVKGAKAAGSIVLADTKQPNFRRLTLDDIADTLPLIDYITPNREEAAYYTGKTDPEEMADVFLEKGVRNVIIKLGSEGCLLKNGNLSLRLPAHEIDVVDATGAGDNLIAGFASELLRGSSPEDALRFGNACGAICTTATGAGTGLRSREQVLEFMRR